MTVIRVEKTEGFTVMSNFHLRDKRLTWKAKGILSVMLSLPENWDYSIAGLAVISVGGLDMVRSGLKELEGMGYLTRKPIKEKGKIVDWEYTVYEQPHQDKPHVENPHVENPQVEKPHVENPTQINTKEINTKESNTKETITKEQKGDKRVNYQLIADLYNDTCVSFPRLRSLSDDRKKAIKARLKTYTMEDFRLLFEKAEASSFLKGKNPRNWFATFDWLIADKNMAKVLDGNYDDRSGGSAYSAGSQNSGRPGGNVFLDLARDDDMFYGGG